MEEVNQLTMVTDIVNVYLMTHKEKQNSREWVVPTITCKDGFNLSVQASEYHYCSPREKQGPWYQVEVGFPSQKPELITDYAENADDPTGTVYGYVPVELVNQLIALHGGIEGFDADSFVCNQ